MKTSLSSKGASSFRTGAALLAALVVCLLVFLFVRHENAVWLETALEKNVQKTRLVQAMRSELLASAEAEKSAVMADTDEASRTFAEQSEQASREVEKTRVELSDLVDKNSREAGLLQEFTTSWQKLQEVDKEVLTLAVKNTNLKAFQLSFGPAAEAIHHMEASISRLMDVEASSADAAQITRVASKALTDALNIEALEAPHIAENTDEGMGTIEARMKELDGRVRDGLTRLDKLVDESGRPFLDEASQSYREFQICNAEILDLSRQNSNIRSFAVSLGQKRNAMAQCLDLLTALQQAVQQSSAFKATR